MNPLEVLRLLAQVRDGALSVEQASKQLARLPFEELGFARVDHHRALRQRLPEVIFAEGKTTTQVCAIAQAIHNAGQTVFATRVSPEQSAALKLQFPEMHCNPVARTARLSAANADSHELEALIVTAGTTDLPVAEEAAETLLASGYRYRLLVDVGVAGLHRLLDALPVLQSARVIIAVAGMEGALPSVVAGLVAAPVIAVPTSTGYGVSAGGFSALFSMLGSCSPGVSVVNVDNGYGAALAAVRVLGELVRATENA